MIEDMAELHMTEAELVKDIAAVLAKVRQGAKVVVEHDHRPVAVLRPAAPPRRKISEVLALMPKDSTAHGRRLRARRTGRHRKPS